MSSKRTSCPRSIMFLHHATLKLSFKAATLPILPILYSFKIASRVLSTPTLWLSYWADCYGSQGGIRSGEGSEEQACGSLTWVRVEKNLKER